MFRRLAASSVVVSFLALALSASAGAATTVENQSDAGPGSLREAVLKAPSGETIVVPAGTYTLTSGSLEVTGKTLTIQGHGAAETTIVPQMSETILKAVKSTLTISGLTLRGAHLSGSMAVGGALVGTESNLTLRSVAVLENAVRSNGTKAKEAGGTAIAAGIAAAKGTLTISGSTISGNVVEANGGPESHAGMAAGGGIYYVGSSLTIEGTTIEGNHVSARGGDGPSSALQDGGIASGSGIIFSLEKGGSATIGGTTVSNGIADASGGPGGSHGQAAGAGIFATTEGAVAISDTTVVGNVVRVEGEASAPSGGGGLFFIAPTEPVRMVGMTIARNGSSGPAAETAAANLVVDGKAAIGDSIVSEGDGPAGNENCSGLGGLKSEITSLGFNIDSLDQCSFHGTGDRVNTNPQLGPLHDNGGPTQTMLPAATSPAIDQGSAFGASADQRGVMRPIDFPAIANASGGDGSDIGAVELAPASAFAKLGPVKKNRKKGTGVLRFSLPLPSAGQVSLRGKKLKSQKALVKGATGETLKLVPTKGGRKALRRKGKLKVRFELSYAPTGSQPAVAVGKATLVLKKKHKRRRRR